MDACLFLLFIVVEFYTVVSTKVETTVGGTTTTTENDTDVKDNVKGFEASLIFGAGVKIPIMNDYQIFIDGRYNLGLTTTDDTSADQKITNNVIQINVGILIPIN